VRPVVVPPEGVKTDYDLVRELAPRLGLHGDFSVDAESWKRRMLAPVADRGASLEDLQRGAVRSPLAGQVMFADRKFATASGRVNLIHKLPPEPAGPRAGEELLLMPLATEKSQASQWVAGADEGFLPATVHPRAAAGFRDGQLATIQSPLGRLTVQLRFDERQRDDVLIVPKGGWLRTGRCANALVPAAETDAGGCAVYFDTPVRILPHRP
jgi:anaerobic selenocysteine-containing dehydrogenase